MDVAGLSFHASAAVAVSAALVAVASHDPRRSLAGFAIALAATIIPLAQLRAELVAGVVLLADAIVVALLAGVLRFARVDPAAAASRRPPVAFWLLAGLGLAGFCWVLLATGSRQVVEHAPMLEPRAGFGAAAAVLDALGDLLVASLLVALLALCAVIAAVLTLVGEGERGGGGSKHGREGAPS